MLPLLRLVLSLLLLGVPLVGSPLKPGAALSGFNGDLSIGEREGRASVKAVKGGGSAQSCTSAKPVKCAAAESAGAGQGRECETATKYSDSPDKREKCVASTDATDLPLPTKPGPFAPGPPSSERLNRTGWTIKFFDSQETRWEKSVASNVLDGSKFTFWHTCWSAASNPGYPHEIQLDMKAVHPVTGLAYLPRQDGVSNGRIADYQLYISVDGTAWGEPVATGKWTDTAEEKVVTFPSKPGRYVRLVALSEVRGQIWASAAEINVLGSEK